MESQARSSISIAEAMVGFVAALFTRMSIVPNSSMTFLTRLFISSIFPIWAATGRHFLPVFFIASATFFQIGYFPAGNGNVSAGLG